MSAMKFDVVPVKSTLVHYSTLASFCCRVLKGISHAANRKRNRSNLSSSSVIRHSARHGNGTGKNLNQLGRAEERETCEDRFVEG